MPPTTRRSQTSSSSRTPSSRIPSQQQTLNFRSATKVTKPAVILPGKPVKAPDTSSVIDKASIRKPEPEEEIKEKSKEEEEEEEEEGEEEEEKEEREEKVSETALEPEKLKAKGDEEESLESTKNADLEFDETSVLTTYIPPTVLETPLSHPSIPSILQDLSDDIILSLTTITPSEITTYHKTILAQRLGSPIHQSSLSKDETILRNFDLSYQYGPYIGITRINRWKRAHRMGLKPPMEVLKVLIAVEERGGAVEKGFKGVGGGGVGGGKRDERTAFIDEEMSTRSAHE